MKKNNTKHKCVACKKQFHYNCLLKYHIRREHFNLKSFRPYYETQNINQIWFEKVLNTDFLAKMTKLSNNMIAVQKLNEGTTIKPTEIVPEEIDLHLLYPTNRTQPLKCSLCSEPYTRKKLKRHFKEIHGLVLKKVCDKCKKKFRSPMGVVNHICSESSVE
ncbi:zinc finger protein 624-like [Spodoptera litura]|uniref:Zinc finger protein 624-like n=1 Tax=Spodoptera litura TaxID=69820 RepID=A0A9J7ES44_SPOLT|nr:zinc finger protein 624-like [Spodoptera litura]